MHTNELDVRQLLELISRRSGMNILVSPKVSGTITANFEKVTIQELLGSILKLADLVEKVEGGIHFIYSKEELKDVAETAKKERIVTKVYRLNYIRADELMVMISPFLSSDVGRKRFATSANYQFGISESSTLSTGGAGGGGGGGGGRWRRRRRRCGRRSGNNPARHTASHGRRLDGQQRHGGHPGL